METKVSCISNGRPVPPVIILDLVNGDEVVACELDKTSEILSLVQNFILTLN